MLMAVQKTIQNQLSVPFILHKWFFLFLCVCAYVCGCVCLRRKASDVKCPLGKKRSSFAQLQKHPLTVDHMGNVDADGKVLKSLKILLE